MKRDPTAVVLAAGASSRFGGTKQIAELGGSRMVERVVQAVPSSRVSETIVVLGHEAAAVERALRPWRGVRVVVNAAYRAGMATSIRAGVIEVSRESRGVLLLLADQPFVTRRLLVRVLDEFDAKGGIVATSRGDVVGPPVAFSRRHFGALEALEGDRGARSVVREHMDEVSLVRVRGRALTDVDTRADLESAGLV
ncbi:MAG: nucleotidyltransferase family protein [Nitrososphaerota archaeon]|nr:nucleotidyltransferase family protein [Nitrososphaerota archaeon]